MRRSATAAATALIIAIALGVFAPSRPAQAAFPGANGKLAFVIANDIWVANADGSGAVSLTTSTAWERSPRWSPDGRKLAFASNRDGDFEIFVMNSDGTDEHQVTFNVGEGDRFPAWTADGGQILYNKDFSSIYATNADGSGGERKVTDGFGPATSPRGKKIVFANGGLWMMQLDGGGLRRVTGGSDLSADWAPQGNELVFTRGSEGDRDVLAVHLSGAGLVNLTNTPTRFEWAPVWSPDGAKIAFVGCPGPFTAPGCNLYVADRDGTNELQAVAEVRGGEGAIDWQPHPATAT